MQPTSRAIVRHLKPSLSTGLTGLRTHVAPRSTLFLIYGITLKKLQSIPPNSLYRQSVEATTMYRMKVLDATIPPGHDERIFSGGVKNDTRDQVIGEKGQKVNAWTMQRNAGGMDVGASGPECITEELGIGMQEGLHAPGGTSNHFNFADAMPELRTAPLDTETQMTSGQVSALEVQFRAGMIEEVIQTAEGEMRLIDEMLQAKIWEDPRDEGVDQGASGNP